MKYSLLSILVGSLLLAGCGGGDRKEVENANTQPPPSNTQKDTILESRNISPILANDVPTTTQQKIVKVSSFNDSTAFGQSLSVPFTENGTTGLMIASDAEDNPILLSIEDNQPMGADTTAYALTVLIMKISDLPTDIDQQTILTNIRKVSTFTTLKAFIQNNLSENILAIDSPEALELAAKVVDESIRFETVKARSVTPVVTAKAMPNNEVTSLPYYFFQNDSATDKMWLSDENNVTLNNRTFLSWQVVMKNQDGQQVYKSTIAPMKKTKSQLLAYYADSETKKVLPTALLTDKVTVEVSQSKDTDLSNAIALVQQATFALIDLSIGAVGASPSKVEECSLAVTKALTNSNEFASAVTSTNIQDWLNYFRTVGEQIPTLITKTCNFKNSKGFGIENANPIIKKAYNRFMSALDLAVTSNRAISGLIQFNRHQKKTYAVDLCFKDGKVGECEQEGFWSGYAQITECEWNNGEVTEHIKSSEYRGGCNVLSGNFNVGDGASISFRESSENLNVRIDQFYGCYGNTASINKSIGSSFIFTYPPEPLTVSDKLVPTHTFTITKIDKDEISGIFKSSWYTVSDGNTFTGKVSGVWTAYSRGSHAFPKCLPPTKNLNNTHSSNFCYYINDYGGCDYRSVTWPARKDEWLP